MLSEEYLNLGVEQVCSLISSDKLTIASEEKVSPPILHYSYYPCKLVLTAPENHLDKFVVSLMKLSTNCASLEDFFPRALSV